VLEMNARKLVTVITISSDTQRISGLGAVAQLLRQVFSRRL